MFFKNNNLALLVISFLTGMVSLSMERSGILEIARQEASEVFTSEIFGIEEELADRINKGHLLSPGGDSAYDIYINYVDDYPDDMDMQRKLKRTLVAALVEIADQALTDYFDYGGAFIYSYLSNSSMNKSGRIIPIDQYYFVAADLSGIDHFLYDGLQSKALFIEALKLRYLSYQGFTVVENKLKQSLALTPDASYTYNELGTLYLEEGYFAEACANLKLAVRLNPKWAIPRTLLSEAENALSSATKD